ncbi:MAG: MBOAT family protein [Treponema sp.]|nr:MBOAT family protein [Treponema sp.]
MLFSSITFLVFFLPAVLIFYYTLPNLAYKNCVLFLASLFFYAWGEPKFVFLMFASIVFNYNMGLFLGNDTAHKKKILAFAILANIVVLLVFKYLGFTCKIIDAFLSAVHIQPLTAINLVMPIGISFYTFQEISYLVDVYRKPELAQKNLLHLGLYTAFFPQLIAGPIVRYHDINEQISARTVTVPQFSLGLERFIIGLSKKVLLANNFAVVCDSAFEADFFSYGAATAWIAAFAYAMQIYYDFSGYSDMAIGLAKLFGFDLLENFNYPYAASSITDFWKRWHISLTNFFRDYVYIPLGGNRKGKLRTVLNRFIVFFTTGLWHGAAFNFILWGLGHGILMTIERAFAKKSHAKEASRKTVATVILSVLGRMYTLFAVLMLWVLFRNGTGASIKLILKLFGINYSRFTSHFQPYYYDELISPHIGASFYLFACLGILFAFPWWKKFSLSCKNSCLWTSITVVKYFALILLLVLCYANLAGNSYNPFIYFRF